jgi:hypothetical protein
LRKIIFTLAKFAISAGIIGYLVYDAQRDQTFSNLASQPKHWGILAAATVVCLTAVMLTFVRWFVLVRALELPFSMKDAFRLGFLGYQLNIV